MEARYSGSCLCGAIRFSVDEEPLTVYACHCSDCQRRTGSALALSMIVRRRAVKLNVGEPVAYSATLTGGRTKHGKMCAACGTRLWGEPRSNEAIAVVQPGTLEQASALTPIAHIWTSEALPWFVFPAGVAKFERQASHPRELLELWDARTINTEQKKAL
jgi:hypothetical protein